MKMFSEDKKEKRNMGIANRVSSFIRRFDNAEANAIERVGEYSKGDDLTGGDGVDLAKATPFKVKRTIINCRNASKDPQVKGILTDTITKTNNDFEIVSKDAQAQKYIEERCKDWDISQLIDDMLYKGMVDGEAFLNIWVEDNKVQFRWLAFDGKNYRIKKIYDDKGHKVIGYAQVTYHNRKSNKGWNRKKFDELVEDIDAYDIKFQPEEIINIQYMAEDGKGRSLVMDVLDDVYYKRTLKELMPFAVYKNSTLVKVTMGNELQQGKRLTRKDRLFVEDIVSNYHNKGTIILPFGIDAEVLKGSTLPDIPSYLKYYEKCIFVGLNTPEAVFTSESSNRATADIQLDSPTSGRVLFLQSNQEWVKKYIENRLFRLELDLNGFEGVDVELKFNKIDERESVEFNDNYYNSPHKPIVKKGAEDGDTTD